MKEFMNTMSMYLEHPFVRYALVVGVLTLNPVSSSADPRAAYRRRLQHRQTTVIGGTLAIMTIVTVVCLMIWTGMLPVPDPGFSEKEKPTAEAQPCPPADAVTSKIVSIPVNVYNGTDSAGLASTVADVLTDAGMTVGATTDWPRGTYEGDVLITSSEAGLTNASWRKFRATCR